MSFSNSGIAFDAAGAMYFVESNSDSVLKRATNGTLTVLTSEAAIIAAAGGTGDPDGIAFGSDGFLYVNDDGSDSVLRINPSTGAVTVHVNQAALVAPLAITSVDMKSSIVGAEGGIIYSASDADPDAIFAITSAGVPSVLASGTPPFNDLDVFMTRAQNGDLIIADNAGSDTIHRVTPAGVVSTFLSEAQLEAVTGADVDLEGGIAFDSSGNFYVADEASESILRFNSALNGSVWIPAAAMQAVTGVVPDLEAGIAFAIGTTPAAIPTINQWGMIILLLVLAGIAILTLRRRAHVA